ncbi:MAG: hypothetical protein LC105_01820 [Chitinophagales bacterium]|nr:hypothetical protein [Chitinophagales bacterium]MCZ2392583.1 hypothetical protein [Chitinophagales bacterium]
MKDQNPFLKIIFKFIAIVFHPLLMPTYGTLLFLWAFPSITPSTPVEDGDIVRTPQHVLMSIIINTFLMPLIAILMMKALGFIKSFEMEDKKDRIIPFIATMTFYIWAFLAVKDYFHFMPNIYIIFILGTVISLMLSFFINLFFKLSIHMVGAGGMLVATMLMMMNAEKSLAGIFLLIIILNGLIATARLYLKAHTIKELYIGFLVGIGGQMVAVTFFSKFLR